jgi:hypothetical protein
MTRSLSPPPAPPLSSRVDKSPGNPLVSRLTRTTGPVGTQEQDTARASAEGAELSSAGITGVKVAAPTGVRSKVGLPLSLPHIHELARSPHMLSLARLVRSQGTTVRNLQEEYQMKHNTMSISSKPDEGEATECVTADGVVV